MPALIPPLVLVVFIACVAGAAALIHCGLLAALIKQPRNGLALLIIQLTVADFLLLITSVVPDLWTTNARTWDFGRSACISFRGLSILASTASLYLVVTIALHTLATINLEERVTARSRRSVIEDEEMRSSRHSLVANSDSSTPPRTMNVDYRISADTKVPIVPPTFFVWFLSISLSIPEFTLSTTVRLDDLIACTLEDSTHRFNIHSMLALFNFFIPTLIMSTAGILVAFKLSSKCFRKNEFKHSLPALKLSLSLIIVYFAMCAPRSLFYVYGIYIPIELNKQDQNENQFNIVLIINLICTGLYLTSTLVRPLLCITLLPKIRKKLFGDRDIIAV